MQYKVLALDLDGTLTNTEKVITPRTKAALQEAARRGVCIVLASGRPTVGIEPLARELELEKYGGCILSYNGGKIIDCRTGQTLVQHAFPADLIEPVCTFSRYWNVVPLTYDKNGIVTEVPDAPYVLEEARINKIPVRKVENLPAEVTYPINKLLLTGDPADMPHVEELMQQEFAGIRILKDVDSDIEERGLQTLLTINRDALARLGLTMKDVDAALDNAFGQRQVSTIYEEKNQYRVVLEYALPWLEGEDSLGKVWLPGKDGAVPLLGVAEVSPAFAPLSVAHQGQFAAVTLSFNLAEGASLSQAQAAIDEARVRIGMPSTIVGSFQGTAKMYSDTVREQVLLILAALAALYIVLGVLYESLIHPLTILSTLPSAGIGALLALRACGMEFSVIALIGVLLLCGIVKKNAIMMIDFAIEAARTRNLPPREAIHEACRLRFRPIMMTTAAAILGAVPLALGQGDGAEIRQPLGITIVGGLLVSQLLTLYTTPVVYLCLDRARLRWRRRWWRLRYGERKAALLTALCRQG